MSTIQAIRERVSSMPAGEAFTPSTFAGVGSRAAVDMALMRLVKEGLLVRAARGVYTLAEINEFGFQIIPAPKELALAKVAMTGVTVEVHGAEAVQRFGFSTQVPVQPVFYTSGTSRKFRVGKLNIKLQHVASRKLALAGRPAGEALIALWYLGKHEVTAETFDRLAKKLPVKEFQALRQAKSSMPAWMADALRSYESNEVAHAA
jgi:hypothetical protein